MKTLCRLYANLILTLGCGLVCLGIVTALWQFPVLWLAVVILLAIPAMSYGYR